MAGPGPTLLPLRDSRGRGVFPHQNNHMTTKMKRQRQTELPRFAVGALAIAGASAANGVTVQITFGNNLVTLGSVGGGVHLDLTGDLLIDVIATSLNQGNILMAYNPVSPNIIASIAPSWVVPIWEPGALGFGNRVLVPFSFSDWRINNSALSSGYLDMEAASGEGIASLQIHRLIFDANSTNAPTGVTSASTGLSEWSAASGGGGTSAVPEASTSLGLLALGAGGLLTRRRLKRAA